MTLAVFSVLQDKHAGARLMASFSTSLPPMVWPNLMETKKFCTTRHGRGATIKVSDLSEGTARIEENRVRTQQKLKMVRLSRKLPHLRPYVA